MKLIIILIFLGANITPAQAVIHPETYLSENLEKRASNLFSQIKCPVCKGQTIEDSFVPISKQIRNIIRQMLKEGKSDKEIKNYLVKNFGESIIAKVEFKLNNIYLIILPIILIIFGFYAIIKYAKRN